MVNFKNFRAHVPAALQRLVRRNNVNANDTATGNDTDFEPGPVQPKTDD